MGCATPVAQADLMTPTILPPSRTALATPTLPDTPMATPASILTPTTPPTPTAIPTIAIPLLTRTLTPPQVPTATLTPSPLDGLPERVIADPFGVNIHFTHALPGELNLLAAAGFRWVRMDLFWNTIEYEPGRYNFSEYDALVAALTPRDIRLIFVLDYGNPLYDDGFAPHSPTGRAAFARFAAAAVRRYRGKGIIWEIWNEPNLDHFWSPTADVERYGTLLLETVAAIRRADPTALVVAPATSGYDWPFWTALGARGVFTKLDAVTVHSYGLETPEQVGPLYVQLTAFLQRYSPQTKLPILSGEWGYSSVKGGLSEEQQAQYLVRQWLINLAHDVNLSIWYDWRDDGIDPADVEQNFGTVHHDLSPKPAYHAAQTLLKTLAGYRFMRRIPSEQSSDYILLLQKESHVALAMWTTDKAHPITLPIPVAEVESVTMTGARETLPVPNDGVTVNITASPRYLLFDVEQLIPFWSSWRPEESLQCLSAGSEGDVYVIFDKMPLSVFGTMQVRLQGEVRGSVPVITRPMEEHPVRIPVEIGGLKGNVPAEIVFLMPDGTQPPLHAAAIWLLIGEHAP